MHKTGVPGRLWRRAHASWYISVADPNIPCTRTMGGAWAEDALDTAPDMASVTFQSTSCVLTVKDIILTSRVSPVSSDVASACSRRTLAGMILPSHPRARLVRPEWSPWNQDSVEIPCAWRAPVAGRSASTAEAICDKCTSPSGLSKEELMTVRRPRNAACRDRASVLDKPPMRDGLRTTNWTAVGRGVPSSNKSKTP